MSKEEGEQEEKKIKHVIDVTEYELGKFKLYNYIAVILIIIVLTVLMTSTIG